MKDIIGLSIEGKTIKLSRVKQYSKKIRLHQLEEIPLAKRIRSSADNKDEATDSLVTEQPEDIFGIEENTQEELVESTEEPEEEELFDLSQDEADIVDSPDTNELLLSNLLTSISRKKIDCILNIQTGSTVFHLLNDADYREYKTKEIRQTVVEKLQKFYGDNFSTVIWSAQLQSDGTLLISSIEGPPPLLKIVDQTIPLYPGKIFIHDIIPSEIALVGLIRVNHDLHENEISAIVQVTEKTTRIIILKGSTIRSILPLINEGYASQTVMNTIFSKILLELDQGNIPKIDKIILDNPKQVQTDTFFLDRFPDVQVEAVQIKNDAIEIHPNLLQKTSQFNSVIATAMGNSKFLSDYIPEMSLVPEYVLDRQKVLKLEWHGIALLILVALTPIIINNLYMDRLQQTESLKNQIILMENQIETKLPIKAMVDSMMSEYSVYESKLARYDSLSHGILKWSRTLEIVSEGFRQVNSSWLTSFNASADLVEIEGYSLYQNRIPRLASLFADAEILEITGEEIREVTLYKFKMRINRITDTPVIFEPMASIEL